VATGQTKVSFLHSDLLVLDQFLQFVIKFRKLVEDNSSEAIEEFGPPFVPSLILLAGYISLPFLISMFILAPLMIIPSTKSTKAHDFLPARILLQWRNPVPLLKLPMAITVCGRAAMCHMTTSLSSPLPVISFSFLYYQPLNK
jgi:hypothetical protein